MPDDYYVLQRSGEEIEELLDKAGSATGAVRYDAAQSLTAAQQTQARGNINAAPGGYGYGEYLWFKKWDDNDGSQFESYLDSLIDGTNKMIRLTELADYPSNILSGNAGWADVSIDSAGNILVEWCGPTDVVAGTVIGIQKAYKKRLIDGTWLPWEYANPPIALGVEYRTTERYLGKPVYVKAVDCGNLPAPGSTKNVSHGISGCLPIMVTAQMSNSNTIPWLGKFTVGADNTNIVLYSPADTSDFSGLTAMAILKYTKTTD